jgi:hypothetical protein
MMIMTEQHHVELDRPRGQARSFRLSQRDRSGSVLPTARIKRWVREQTQSNSSNTVGPPMQVSFNPDLLITFVSFAGDSLPF